MAPPSLVRLGGLVAVVAGVLLLITDLWNLLLEILVGSSENFSEFAVTTSWAVMSATYLIGGLLLLVALVGLYASSVGGRRRFGTRRLPRSSHRHGAARVWRFCHGLRHTEHSRRGPRAP